MREQETIKKLHLLKTIQPTKGVLLSIKRDVYQRIQLGKSKRSDFRFGEYARNISYLMRSYTIAFYASISVFVCIVFLSASIVLLPNQTHMVLLFGRLAFAPNQYEKARIALEDTRNRFLDNKIAHANTNELAYSLTITNTQLNALKLKGEKGKYTAQQCHQLYQEYLNYLENKERTIQSNNTSLKSEINVYEEQAERKLHMYHSL